jgi:NADH-quinone oxidoreductase subunit C
LQPEATDIRGILEAAGITGEVESVLLGTVARVRTEDVIGVLAALKGAGYESLVDFDGIDTGEAIELTWRVRSYALDAEAYVKATVDYDAEIRSVWNVYPIALMPERETAELFGLSLSGHPNPKRLLTTDGVPPLLRKSVPVRTEEEVRRQ